MGARFLTIAEMEAKGYPHELIEERVKTGQYAPVYQDGSIASASAPSDSSKRSADHPTLGRCRRHAPTMNGYPVVTRRDWCGDHKLKTTAGMPTDDVADTWQHRSVGMRCATCIYFVPKD